MIYENKNWQTLDFCAPSSPGQRKTELEMRNDLSKMGICAALTIEEKAELIEIYKTEKVEE